MSNIYQVNNCQRFESMSKKLRIKPNVSLATKASNVLREFIFENYKDGGKIPGEFELSEQLGVNRGTIRQALRTLEHEGIVIRRQGDGTYVGTITSSIDPSVDTIRASVAVRWYPVALNAFAAIKYWKCGDADGDDEGPNILDLTFMVDLIFRGGDDPPIPAAADLDAEGGPNIIDLTMFVDLIFRGGDQPTCEPAP